MQLASETSQASQTNNMPNHNIVKNLTFSPKLPVKNSNQKSKL
jgi:hypothetical protein